MTSQFLSSQIFEIDSYLCVGLDTDIQKLPSHLPATAEGMLIFNQAIIQATQAHCVSYKINTAFYESLGAEGWEVMKETLRYIPKNKFTIADAKRGDIGNTVEQYAKAFFQNLTFDSITVAPYMGRDSVSPFLSYADKWVILLALTSNPSSADFQLLDLQNQKKLFEQVLETSSSWASQDQIMYVVGATQAEYLQKIREIVPHHFLLIPGVGAQGGSLAEVSRVALTPQGGLLVNVSRQILYASSGEDFAEKAGIEAQTIQKEMADYLKDLK
jgi:orotidine-5'-phosphate decarboxylase